jgi:hypothetical protein
VDEKRSSRGCRSCSSTQRDAPPRGGITALLGLIPRLVVGAARAAGHSVTLSGFGPTPRLLMVQIGGRGVVAELLLKPDA